MSHLVLLSTRSPMLFLLLVADEVVAEERRSLVAEEHRSPNIFRVEVLRLPIFDSKVSLPSLMSLLPNQYLRLKANARNQQKKIDE